MRKEKKRHTHDVTFISREERAGESLITLTSWDTSALRITCSACISSSFALRSSFTVSSCATIPSRSPTLSFLRLRDC